MILRRVIVHFRQQEWTAIAIDFLIVVAGVFVGLQVNNWNEARRQSQDEMTTLVRLHDEAEEVVIYLQRLIGGFRERLAWQETAVAALFDGEGNPVAQAKFDGGLMSLIFYPTIAPRRAVYDELVGAGLANSIADSRVRAAISAYYAQLDFAQGQLAFFRVGNDRLLTAAGDGFTADYDPASDERISIRFEAGALRANRQFKTLAVGAMRNQIVTQRFRTQLLETAETMCRELARTSGRPCAPLEKNEATP
jgi:hypothetical protein